MIAPLQGYAAAVSFDANTLVIETYQQLFAVAAVVLAALATLSMLMRPRPTPRHIPIAAPRSRPAGLRGAVADRQEFDRLATVIEDVRCRAETAANTQSMAALKLDTVEMAVHRLLADMDGIMAVPRTSAITTATAAAFRPASTPAA